MNPQNPTDFWGPFVEIKGEIVLGSRICFYAKTWKTFIMALCWYINQMQPTTFIDINDKQSIKFQTLISVVFRLST